MGSFRQSYPALLISAVFSRYPEALDWATQKIEQNWGPLAATSPPFWFDDTQYYEPSMGSGLQKMFIVVADWFDAEGLAQRKLESNEWELAYAQQFPSEVGRPLNIDPGYLTSTKLVLASSKERAHRVYLQQGVFAEVTMKYVGGWQFYPWTYSDYQRPQTVEFFTSSRKLLLEKLDRKG